MPEGHIWGSMPLWLWLCPRPSLVELLNCSVRMLLLATQPKNTNHSPGGQALIGGTFFLLKTAKVLLVISCVNVGRHWHSFSSLLYSFLPSLVEVFHSVRQVSCHMKCFWYSGLEPVSLGVYYDVPLLPMFQGIQLNGLQVFLVVHMLSV